MSGFSKQNIQPTSFFIRLPIFGFVKQEVNVHQHAPHRSLEVMRNGVSERFQVCIRLDKLSVRLLKPLTHLTEFGHIRDRSEEERSTVWLINNLSGSMNIFRFTIDKKSKFLRYEILVS